MSVDLRKRLIEKKQNGRRALQQRDLIPSENAALSKLALDITLLLEIAVSLCAGCAIPDIGGDEHFGFGRYIPALPLESDAIAMAEKPMTRMLRTTISQ
jgi:hypothetical protein